MRVPPVATIVGMVAEGRAEREILEAYLEREHIREALEFAAEAVRERQFPSPPAGEVRHRQRALAHSGFAADAGLDKSVWTGFLAVTRPRRK